MFNQGPDTILISIVILVFSVVIHELAHGYAALSQGDQTAKYAGRLTLNPIKHLDLFGSIILPLIFAILPGGLIFGWAKPIPYNPYNLKNRRFGELFVALAGPLSNIFLVLFFGLLIRFSPALGLPQSFMEISLIIVLINVVLAFFNLIPVPPLDGSKILNLLFPKQANYFNSLMSGWGIIFTLIFVLLIWQFVFPLAIKLVELVTNLNFL